VDSNGGVYVIDSNNNRVLALPAKSTAQTVLPFTGLNDPSGVAVDSAGNRGFDM
jgi:serine/threonine protein kinase, bacterial